MEIKVYFLFLPFFLLLVFLLWFIYLTNRKIEEIKKSKEDNQSLLLLQQQVGQLNQLVVQQLGMVQKQLKDTTGEVGLRLGEVKKDLGGLAETARNIQDLAKDISNLENLLKAPKFRGGFGELFLGELLSSLLPPSHYTLQYQFKNGTVVDAVVKIGENLVPVDAKFPLENFRKMVEAKEERTSQSYRRKFIQDVKRHIQEIASKYILPDEGTYDFALMYIPAENIYYETIIKEGLPEEESIFQYSLNKRVIPVSPNSFYAYLQVVVLGLKGLRVEKKAREILENIMRLNADLLKFKDDFSVLGRHLSNARVKFEEAEKKLFLFSERLESVHRLPEP